MAVKSDMFSYGPNKHDALYFAFLSFSVCLITSHPSLSCVRAYGSAPGRAAPIYLWSCLYLLSVSGNQKNWSQSLLWWQQWKMCGVQAHRHTIRHTNLQSASLLLMWCQSHGFQASSSVNHNQTLVFNRFKSSTCLLRLLLCVFDTSFSWNVSWKMLYSSPSDLAFR